MILLEEKKIKQEIPMARLLMTRRSGTGAENGNERTEDRNDEDVIQANAWGWIPNAKRKKKLCQKRDETLIEQNDEQSGNKTKTKRGKP